VVAAGHRLTAEAGADVLRSGGTAFDAAIAAVAMACVCEPILCSPGGGGFAMIRNGSSGETSLLDFFVHTPRARAEVADGVREVHADFGTATQRFHIGPATSATPGFFPGVAAIHAAGATWPLADCFAAAMSAARDGVEVTPFQHHLSTVVAPIVTATAAANALFAPDGGLLAAGARLHNPGLARAFEVMAADGFASSPVGAACVEQQARRGHLTRADLECYEVVERQPIRVQLGRSTLCLNPAPAASGRLIAHSLDHLESPDPVDVARSLCATDRARRSASGELAALAAVPLRQRGTTHVSVIDTAGNVASVTMSNGEGNGEIVDGFGFMLNNVLGEEDVNHHGTHWPLDTRLSSMMCPAVVERPDGGVVALGSGGSNRIRSAILQVVTRLCLGGASLEDAVSAPRLHVENDHLDFEDLFPAATRDELVDLFPDHLAWPRPDIFYGGAHSAELTADGVFHGVGDTRRDGIAVLV
jgi:gamma-glutamyltranspeptidase/glutathione hydrolase